MFCKNKISNLEESWSLIYYSNGSIIVTRLRTKPYISSMLHYIFMIDSTSCSRHPALSSDGRGREDENNVAASEKAKMDF